MSEEVGSVTRKKSSDFHGGIRFQSSFTFRWELEDKNFLKIDIIDFSLPYTLFGACGTVFITNLKIHSRKISLNEYFKAILHYFGVDSLSGFTTDRCTELSWNRPIFDSALSIWSIGHIDQRGKDPFIEGLPRWNMNSKVQISGKSMIFDGKQPKWKERPNNFHLGDPGAVSRVDKMFVVQDRDEPLGTYSHRTSSRSVWIACFWLARKNGWNNFNFALMFSVK